MNQFKLTRTYEQLEKTYNKFYREFVDGFLKEKENPFALYKTLHVELVDALEKICETVTDEEELKLARLFTANAEYEFKDSVFEHMYIASGYANKYVPAKIEIKFL